MKIRTDQTSELQRLEQTQGRSTAKTGTFQNILDQANAKVDETTAAQAAPPPLGIRSLGIEAALPAENVSSVSQTSGEAAQAAMDRIEGVLNQWDNYAQSLGDTSESGGLRQAYGMLEGIAGEVRGLKEDAAALEAHPGLKSLVDELDVLATVEQFKFNRGDYQ